MTKTVKIFFTLSILINIALLGGLASHMVREYQDTDLEHFQEEITPETRNIMRSVYREKRFQIWELRDDMRQKNAALKKTIMAEQFDPKAFEVQAEALKVHNEKSYDSRVNTFLKVLQKLPYSERQKLAQNIVDILGGQRKWDKSKGKPGSEAEESKNPFNEDLEKKEKPKK